MTWRKWGTSTNREEGEKHMPTILRHQSTGIMPLRARFSWANRHHSTFNCSMSACNRFSESVVHIACRRASFEVADYVLSNGGDCNIVDDYGRTPLHDACWRMEPRFDVVTLLLDKNLDLLRTLDVRGSTPLKYVREEHWIQWCAYLFHQKDKYWIPTGDPSENNRRLRSFEWYHSQ